MEWSIAELLKTVVAGLNFEDQVVGSVALCGTVERTAAMPTQIFLLQTDVRQHANLMRQAIARAYHNAGADGFLPGLTGKRLIGRLCTVLDIPVNVILGAPPTPIDLDFDLDVARISVGLIRYQSACSDIADRFGACADDLRRWSNGLKAP